MIHQFMGTLMCLSLLCALSSVVVETSCGQGQWCGKLSNALMMAAWLLIAVSCPIWWL